MNLYELTQEMIELDDLLASADDPDDPAIAEAIERALELHGARESKVDAYCALIAEINARAAARKAEAQRLADSARVAENNVKRLKARLLEAFNAMGIGKLETERFTVSVANNGGKAPLEIDPEIDPATLPKEYQRITISPDSDAIRAALATTKLPFAKLGERGQHVRIK